jgi:hypothetical protein
MQAAAAAEGCQKRYIGNLPYPNTGIDHTAAQGPPTVGISKLCHRGNLTKPLCPRTCQAGTLLATLAGRPHTGVSGIRSTLAGSGARTRDPLMQGERLLPLFAHWSYFDQCEAVGAVAAER